MKIYKEKKRFYNLPDDKIARLYFIHHMHHFKTGNRVKHELHHCFLFTKKNSKGKRYSVVHKINKGEVYHCLDDKLEGVLYDHANHAFRIAARKLNSQTIYEIKV